MEFVCYFFPGKSEKRDSIEEMLGSFQLHDIVTVTIGAAGISLERYCQTTTKRFNSIFIVYISFNVQICIAF